MQVTQNEKLDVGNFKMIKTLARSIRATLTPELCKHILGIYNDTNRSLTESTVDAYARDIAAGSWQYNGEAISFDTRGQLQNGQHRLAAHAKAGKPFVVDVLFGLPPEAVKVVDSGKSRSVADTISIVTGKKETLSVSRLRSVRNAVQRHRSKLTVADFETLRSEFDGINQVNQVVTSNKAIGRAPIAAGFVIAATAYPKEVTALLERLKTGTCETVVETRMHDYIFMRSESDSENDQTDKVLYGIYAQVVENRSEMNRLQTNRSEILSHFLDRILAKKGTKAVHSFKYLAKK